jgi:predicted component of viral defense system (DUF524 family)
LNKMTVLLYNKNDRIAISSDPYIPKEEELDEKVSLDKETLSIEEWKSYYIKFYGDEVPDFFRTAPFYTKPFQRRLFEINFKNYVGLTRIGDIALKIENKKIGDELYDAILDYVTRKYAGLVFSFDSAVGLEFKKGEAGQDIPYLQYLFLKKYLLDQSPNLDEITGLILSRPNRKMLSETQKCFINEVDYLDVALALDIFSKADKMGTLRKGHPLSSSRLGQLIHERTNKNLYPSEIKKIRKYYTFDTNENRFIKYFLEEILKTLYSFELAITKSGTYLNPEILANILLLSKKVRYFLSHPMWIDVGKMDFLPIQSTVLQRREGYRHLFRLFSLLQLVTRYQFLAEDFRSLIEIKDVPTLYEYWCFFIVKDILDERLKPTRYTVIVPPSDTEQKVQEGIALGYEGKITLLYNYSYLGSIGVGVGQTEIFGYETSESYSHSLRPDIVIVKDGKEKLILDAKYKGERGVGGLYGEETEGAIDSYKQEDLDKMHTYRDAIENVYGAFALYPGNKPVIYPSHEADSVFRGIGALPLKPVPGGNPHPEHVVKLKEVIDSFIGLKNSCCDD